jgi:hypothetical protein
MVSTICHWSSSNMERKIRSHQGLLTSEVGRVAVVETGNGEMRKGGFMKRCGKMEEKIEGKNSRRNAFRVPIGKGNHATRARGDFLLGGCDLGWIGYATMSVMNHAYARKVRAW